MLSRKKENIQLSILCAGTLLSRIPFLFPGYGSEEDSWGIVKAVRNTFESGVYEPSRLPGHPVHEAFYLSAPNAGPLFYNGLTALMSMAAVLFFALSLRKLGVKPFLLSAYALAFVPVFFISSTYTIDYNWTLAFTMMSFYFLLSEKYPAAGIFLALATGCRITAAAMIIPFLLFIFFNKRSLRNSLLIFIPFTLISLLVFIPLINNYGAGFFMFYDQFTYPSLAKVIYKLTIGVFGLTGCLGIIFSKILVIKNKLKAKGEENFSNGIPVKLILICMSAILIYFIAYLRLPQKSGYLVQILPFTILVLACYLELKYFKWICYSFILSSFIFSINLTDEKRGASHSSLAMTFNLSGQELFLDPITGPMYADHTKRIQKAIFTDEVIAVSLKRKTKFILISGWWYNEIAVELKERGLPNYCSGFVSYIDKAKCEAYKKEDREIYYLPEQDKYNDEYSKMNFTDSIAKPFIENR